jgi:integrase
LEFLPKNSAAKLVVPRSGKKASNQPLTHEQIPQVLFHLGGRDRLIVRMFLVLGLRPGEMFALRWNDKQGNSLRIDTAIVDGIEVETKTQGSDAAVWLPVSIEKEFEFWRSAAKSVPPDSFIFPSSRGTAINTNNFLFRVLKEAGKKAPNQGSDASDAPAHLLHLHGPAHDRKGRARRTCAPQLLSDHAGTLHQVRAGECARGGRIA